MRRRAFMTAAVAASVSLGGSEARALEARQPVNVCRQTATSMCLLGGRFTASVAWENQFDGSRGTGGALPLTDFSGLFYFTDSANPELMLKVIDFGDRVRVFYGQLTNLRFVLTVVDSVTGEQKVYRNTEGDCGAVDAAAFPSTGGRSEVLLYKGLEGPLQGTCTPGSTRLCLVSRRFSVEVSWRNQYNGTEGAAHGRATSDFAGVFDYGDSRNVELLTKALDFGDRILFIYGALSDLEYRIRVTDTRTGAVKEYSNPAGRFCGGLDNDAFPRATCTSTLSFGSSMSGQWASSCNSAHRGADYYVRYFTFVLPTTQDVQIDLSSREDAFMYLLAGAGPLGAVLASDDDDGGGTDARIVRRLGAGTYTIEATTFAPRTAGAFTVTAKGAGIAPPPAVCGPGATGDRFLGFAYIVESANSHDTMQDVRLLFDGLEVGRYNGPPESVIVFTESLAGVGPGPHCVSIRVVQQTVSPSPYRLGSSVGLFPNTIVVNAPGRASELVFLPRDVVSLQTGSIYSQAVVIP